MYKVLDDAKDDVVALYIDSEEDNFEYEFWARLFNSLKKE